MKRFLLALCALLSGMATYAQQNALAFPSANNSFLGQLGGSAASTMVDADLYSGMARISVAICNITGREMTVPVGLNYTGSRGIKVQEYAGSAGLGWQLDAGGNISRVVRGFPDEFSNGYVGTGQWGNKVTAWRAGTAGLPNQVSGWNGSNFGTPTADGEPDIFYVKTPQFSFQFVFDGNGHPVFSNATGIKITGVNFANSYSSASAYFIVKDDQGNKYYFGTTDNAVEKTSCTLYGSSYTFPTTWYLDRIVSFNEKDNIVFSYTSASGNDVLSHYSSSATYNAYGCSNAQNNTVTSTVIRPKYIYSITTPLGFVRFNYAFDRQDITTSGRLNTIEYWQGNGGGQSYRQLRTFQFHYSYFGAPSTNPGQLRLKLDKVTIQGNTPSTATAQDFKVFTYNTTDNLPARNSPVFDFWGYHTLFTPINGSTDPMIYPELRVPNETKTKANILTGIKDITGGNWTVLYEQNEYFRTSTATNVPIGGLRVKSIIHADPGGNSVQTDFAYRDALGKSTGQVLTESYANLYNSWGNFIVQVVSETASNIYDLNGVFNGYSKVKVSQQNMGYTWSYFSNFSDFADDITFVNSTNPNTAPSINSSTSRAYKRGLLLKQEVYTQSDQKLSETTNQYTSLTSPVTSSAAGFHWFTASYDVCGYSGYTSFSSSYGTLVENYRITKAVKKEYDQFATDRYVENTIDYTYRTDKRLVQTVTTSSSKNPTGGNKVTRYYYPEDTNIPQVTGTEQTAINALKDSNATGVVIHEVSTLNGVNAATHYGYEKNPGGSYNDHVYLTSLDEYRDATLLRKQSFVYDRLASNTAVASATGHKPNGIIYGYQNTYPVAEIRNANATYSSYQSYENNFRLLDPYYTSIPIKVDYTGDVNFELFVQSYDPSWQSATITWTLTGPSTFSGSFCIDNFGSTCNGGYPQTILSGVPAGSYTLEMQMPFDVYATNIMCYYYYPKLIPTLTTEYFYEGFEDQYYKTEGSAHTGKSYYTYNDYQVPFVPPATNRSYIIQWWAWDAGKWVKHEEPYTGPRPLKGVIDDIRIFPTDALMTTYTYNPLVGKTSQIDPAGNTVTYEYDGLGRQTVVRDNDRNILSRACYNFAGQPVNCDPPATYSSVLKSSYVRRNNCPAGFESPNLIYTVPAGTYTSELSQADADQMATNDIIVNGQQWANQNGQCIQTWYNTVQSAGFTRNNCAAGYSPGSVTYTVNAGTYSSTISQADADQQALNDINANGQNYANANGTCTAASCYVLTYPYVYEVSSNITSAAGTVNFNFSFVPMTVNYYDWYNGVMIGFIDGPCIPAGGAFAYVFENSRTWQLNISPAGEITLYLMSGTPPDNYITQVDLVTTFTL